MALIRLNSVTHPSVRWSMLQAQSPDGGNLPERRRTSHFGHSLDPGPHSPTKERFLLLSIGSPNSDARSHCRFRGGPIRTGNAVKPFKTVLAISASLLLVAGTTSPVAAEEDEDAQISTSSMQQYEAWAERVETSALNMSEEELLRQANDSRDYVETTVMIGGQVAARSAESAEEQNARYVKCTARVDNPHYSSGAGGAIYKTRYKCESKGVNTKVSLRVKGLLSLYPAASSSSRPGKAQSRAYSDARITVTANTGRYSTPYYTPVVGSNGGRGTGFWNATSTWIITSHASLSGKRTASQSKSIWRKI